LASTRQYSPARHDRADPQRRSSKGSGESGLARGWCSAWLDGLFATGRRDATVDALYDAGTDPATQARRAAVTARLYAGDQKLAAYRAALEAGADPAVVTGWIAEITAERTRHQIELDQVTGWPRLTRTQIAVLVDQMASIAALLRRADPRDRVAVYDQLGLRLTYKS
jgi:hypothetical protein